MFEERELHEAQALIERAIAEDLPEGDATTAPLFDRAPVSAGMTARFVGRQQGVLAGLPVVAELFRKCAPRVEVTCALSDGHRIEPGTTLAEVRGPASEILRLERTGLNFLQHLSGIATVTAEWVAALGESDAQLVDTRKTTPGWRYLEKYAVRCGGARNHRFNLSDGILVKDNHIAVLRELGRGDFADWVATLRADSPGHFLQVEVDTREQFLVVIELSVDSILLDNFPVDDLRWAVERRNSRDPASPVLEASGGIQLKNIRAIAETGVDRISVGALTHSAPSLDVALDIVDAFELQGDA